MVKCLLTKDGLNHMYKSFGELKPKSAFGLGHGQNRSICIWVAFVFERLQIISSFVNLESDRI